MYPVRMQTSVEILSMWKNALYLTNETPLQRSEVICILPDYHVDCCTGFKMTPCDKMVTI